MKTCKVGAIKFKSASKAAVYMVQKTKYSRSDIAKKLGITPACVTLAVQAAEKRAAAEAVA